MSILAAIDGSHNPDLVVSVGYDIASVFKDTLYELHVVPERGFDKY